ncbi:unannotated protein [freshwater metagenome]|uniref:Unannotated protein n=1 Tax=freshwater metagenome TaxID=449393 RepID=A0A6J7KD88_9ZZZZ
MQVRLAVTTAAVAIATLLYAKPMVPLKATVGAVVRVHVKEVPAAAIKQSLALRSASPVESS